MTANKYILPLLSCNGKFIFVGVPTNFMSSFQTQGFEHHPFVNISQLDKTGIEQERILEHSNTLHQKQVTSVYFRPSLLLEVFIVVDHSFSENDAEFWYNFSFMIAEGLNENTFKIGAGDPKLWESTRKRLGWQKFEID
jgi:hypothetical protein